MFNTLLTESAVEMWLIGHYQCLDADLGVFTGEFNTTMASSRDIYSDEYISCLYETGKIFKKLSLKKEEIVVLKAVVLTFTGSVRYSFREHRTVSLEAGCFIRANLLLKEHSIL